jgi:hypothetical protein
MQRAFLGEPGEPGGCTIFRARSHLYHKPFAEHITAERLINKYMTDLGWRWEWAHKPGALWDWGDNLTGCWVAAALNGLSASGAPVKRTRYIERRKPKVRH